MKAYRIEGHEGSPVRLPLDRHCHAVPGSSYGLRGDGPSAPRLGFHRCPNRPDEAQEFAPDGRHDLLFTFPPRRQGAIARVQPVLRFPGDRFHLFTDGLLTLEERPPPPDLAKTDSLRSWPVERSPFLLETSVPGVFASGDARRDSVKRVASAVGEGSVAVHFMHQVLAER